MKKQNPLWVLAFLALHSNSTLADISSDLKRFFDEAGVVSNTSSASVFKDQSAGYYTGGSVTTRTGIRSAQLATVQMPGFRGGCGGIDAWAGGFSHIRSEELVKMLRNVGSSAASYAFLLAVQTVSPQVYNIMNELNSLATRINSTNINSCEMAATMLGGLWPKSDQSSKHLCQAMGSELGAFSDWAAARQGCGAKGDREKVLKEKASDPRYQDMLVGEFNLTWKALQANRFLSRDPELAQLFMTLVGSIIVRQQGKGFEAINLPEHADRDTVLNGLLNGGEVALYVCDDTKCLNPSLRSGKIAAEQALLRRVHQTLETLVRKIYQDEELKEFEKDFLNSTRLPIYKMLNVITAYRQGAAPLDIHHYGDLIAWDVLYRYVLEILDIVYDSVVQLKAVQVEDSHIEYFLKSLYRARERITVKRNSAFQQMDSVLSFIQATQLIEKQLHVMLGNLTMEKGG